MTLGKFAPLIGGACLIALAGCSSTSTPNPTGTVQAGSIANTPPPAGSANSGGGGSGAPTFTVTVDFSGTYALQGSFADTGTGSGFSSCTQYATMNTPLGWIGPGPQVQGGPAQVGGKALSWTLGVPQHEFHGPGTYSGQLLNAFGVGSDDFGGFTSTITLHADGSGSASFTNASAFTSNTVESGAISWTCAG